MMPVAGAIDQLIQLATFQSSGRLAQGSQNVVKASLPRFALQLQPRFDHVSDEPLWGNAKPFGLCGKFGHAFAAKAAE